MALTELSWRPTITKTKATDITPSLSVRRCLFGPVDHDAVRRDLQREMKTMSEENTRRWNFDFERECPLEGRYLWSKYSSTPSESKESQSLVSNSRTGSDTSCTTLQLNSTTNANLGCVKTSTKNASKVNRKRPSSQKITGMDESLCLLWF